MAFLLLHNYTDFIKYFCEYISLIMFFKIKSCHFYVSELYLNLSIINT